MVGNANQVGAALGIRQRDYQSAISEGRAMKAEELDQLDTHKLFEYQCRRFDEKKRCADELFAIVVKAGDSKAVSDIPTELLKRAVFLLASLLLAVSIALAADGTEPDPYTRAFTAGYDARHKHHLPRSANPYPIPLIKDREWWDDGHQWKGWMPDWREFIQGGESFVSRPERNGDSFRTSYRQVPAVREWTAGRF